MERLYCLSMLYYTIMDFSADVYMMWYAPKSSLLTEVIAEVNNYFFGTYQFRSVRIKAKDSNRRLMGFPGLPLLLFIKLVHIRKNGVYRKIFFRKSYFLANEKASIYRLYNNVLYAVHFHAYEVHISIDMVHFAWYTVHFLLYIC